jgi:cysteine desulfurase
MLMAEMVYLDNNDTTKMLHEVVRAMLPYFEEKYGNPASLHELGLEAENAINSSRKTIAKILGARDDEIIFTSGATEANNLALIGAARARAKRGNHIITSAAEHSSVINVMKWLGDNGFELDILPVDGEGFVDPDELKARIRPETILVSIVHANHEIGTIQDIERLGNICREHDVWFHTDAAQSFCKEPLDVSNLPVDLVSLNSHKLHGPKGVGALYIRKGVRIKRLMEGAFQERNLRPGTENVPGIIGFGKAVELVSKDTAEQRIKMSRLRDRLIDGLMAIPKTKLNGPTGDHRLCNNIDILFRYIEGEAILMHLNLRGIAVSSGSACSSKTLEPSPILTAIGLKHEESHGSIRFSLSRFTTEQDIDYTVEQTGQVVETLRAMSAFVPERDET